MGLYPCAAHLHAPCLEGLRSAALQILAHSNVERRRDFFAVSIA